MTCKQCGCSPCACSPSVLNNPQIVGGVLDGSTLNGPTINGGNSVGLGITGANIDCTTQACTQPPGICNSSIATTAFVCTAVANAISSANPAFCDAVSQCLLVASDALCPTVFNCIQNTPGIINTTNAFGPSAQATETQAGVARYATMSDFATGICGVSVQPCTLLDFWQNPNVGSAMWMAFCSSLSTCGVLTANNAALTGVPTAPTAAAGTCTTQIATTSFVCTAIANAISALNPLFCAAVTGCGGGGGVDCAGISALFPAAGAAPGAAVRFFGSDCQSYTAAQIASASAGGGTVVAWGTVSTTTNRLTGPAFNVADNATAGRFDFVSVPGGSYVVVAGGFDFLDTNNYGGFVGTPLNGNTFQIDRVGVGATAGVLVPFVVVA